MAFPARTSQRSLSTGVRVTAAMGVAAVASFGAVLGTFGSTGDSAAAKAPAVSANEDAAAFVRGVVRPIAANRYAEVWPLLHPSHRSTARRAEYVGCERRSPIPGRLVAVRAGAPFDTTRVDPARLVESRAVPVQVVLLDLATSERTGVRDTVHAVRAEGRWTWILPPERLAEYRVGALSRRPAARSVGV